jgi:hypothetical protein
MLRRMAHGAAAGAVGTLTLDAVSYLDMLWRGRPPSELPAQAAGQLADRLGLDLGEGEPGAHRRAAAGALLGYGTGVAVGIGYGLVRGRRRRVPWSVAGVIVGVAAMGVAAAPLTAQGLTDPREWGLEGWLADIVPHVAYGLAAALTYESLAQSPA